MAFCGGMHYTEGGGHKPPLCGLGLRNLQPKLLEKLLTLVQAIKEKLVDLTAVTAAFISAN